MPTTGRVQGCVIGRNESDLRAIVSSRRAEDVQRCYQAVAAECIRHQVRRALVIGRSSADAFVHLAGRDALRTFAIAGVPAGFRLALVAETPDLIAIYDSAVIEAGRRGIDARRFTHEQDALAWLAPGPGAPPDLRLCMAEKWLSTRDILGGCAPEDLPVTVKGWVRTRRDSKAGISFIHVSDGSSFHPVQVVAPRDLPNYESEVMRLTAGCSVEATGKIVPSPAKGQPFEMQASAVRVVGWVEDPDHYPIQPKPHSLEFLREVAHLRPRTNVIAAATRVRHTIAKAIHRFFDEHGFFWVNTPIITAADAEGAGAQFRVSTLDLANLPRSEGGRVDFTKDFFGRETFLTVSGQLNVEAYCLALSKVYTFGPTFRAENSNTSRHLAEFWMIEPEIAFADLAADADLAEALLRYLFRVVLEERQDDMAFFDERIEKGLVAKLQGIVDSEFVRMDYGEAIAVLEHARDKFEFPVKWGSDLQSEHERYLTEKHAKRPVIVMNYPKAIKAFYMRVNDDGKTVAAMDVLAPGIGEIIGGSQREDRLDVLDARMGEVGINKEHMAWYRDLRRYGTVPHAGFGLGFERTIAYATGLSNVRDVIPFPRTPGHADY